MTTRIGFLTERMLLGYGVDLVVHETARRLIQQGYEVVIFVTQKGEMYENAEYSVINLMDSAETSQDIYTPHFMQDSMKVIIPQKIDAWIIHTPPFYHWLPHLKPPVIMVEHGTPPGKFFERNLGKDLDAYSRERSQKIYRAMRAGDGLAAISGYIRSTLPKDIQDQTVVIHNGADHYPRASQKDAKTFRAEHGVADDDVMLLWVGRIELQKDSQPYKGLAEFLKVAQLFIKATDNVKIVAVGRADESAKADLEQRNIIPALNLPRDQMPIAYAAADIFLNTSKWEGFNLPLVEAQFQGTPVIAYHCCAHPEVVNDGISGILVRSAEELCRKTMDLVKDADYRKQLAAGARKQSSRFSWDKNADALIRLLNGCIQEAERHNIEALAPEDAKKDAYYYWRVGRRLVRREGLGALFREGAGWISRRLKQRLSEDDS